MRKRIAIALTAGVAAATVGIASAPASAAPPRDTCGIGNAHNSMIAGQGLERHLSLKVHQVFVEKFAPYCG
jgi:hypothetical protein